MKYYGEPPNIQIDSSAMKYLQKTHDDLNSTGGGESIVLVVFFRDEFKTVGSDGAVLEDAGSGLSIGADYHIDVDPKSIRKYGHLHVAFQIPSAIAEGKSILTFQDGQLALK